MSLPNQPARDYDPLPLTTDEYSGHQLYNANEAPPSPSFHTPQLDPRDLEHDQPFIPPGAAQPRFLGAAMYNDGPRVRDSYASSQNSYPTDHQSQYSSSVYGLNDQGAANAGSNYNLGHYRDDPSDGSSYFAGERGMAMSPRGTQGRYLEEKRAVYAPPSSKRKVIILALCAAGILLIAAVVIPVYFAIIKPKLDNDDKSDKSGSSGNSTTGGGGGKGVSAAVVTGGDGSQVDLEDGSKMTYSNSFGGYWYWDENDPFNNGAKPNSWTPALNETFRYGIDRIYGVNLGGWLTLEPFISPAVFEPYHAIDEWTLHTALAKDTANGGFKQLEDHYKTFITEKDFAEIAGAGLNYVRLPIPYWAIETRPGEPFLPKTAWTYFLKAIQWARKYGIRINVDLHAVPGSQNGWNHSGRLGSVNLLNGAMGLANAQRTLDYIRIIAEFISQDQYKDVCTMFGITNEPQGSVVGQDVLSAYYLEAYKIVRNAGGTGEGKGPWISFHDGFFTREMWKDFLVNGDRMLLDSHPYMCFGGQSANPMSSYANAPCQNWGGAVNQSMSDFGMTSAGEWSNAVTDCGLFLNGVDLGTRYEGDYTGGGSTRVGDCKDWTDYANFSQDMKDGLKTFAMASMDALQNWFFWTWKIGASKNTGKIESPAWSYQLGLENGWMPKDPREANGQCGNNSPWQPPLKSWQTGGQGAGDIQSTQFAWPPASISHAGAAGNLPTYTPTGAVPTLPGPTFTMTGATATPSVGSGWANTGDNAGLMVEVAGCNYLDPWVGEQAAPPAPLCGAAKRDAPLEAREPMITGAPLA